MKHGCMVMTLRLSSSHCSASCHIHCSWKKCVKFTAMSSPCWSFFDIQSMVHKEFVPPGHTVNDMFYREVLKQLRDGIRCKHTDKWKKNNWFIHHDNVPAHTSLVVQQFLTPKNITVIPHPPFAWPCPLQLLPIPHKEITAERVSFWHFRGDPRRKAKGYQHNHIWELPGMHEIMGNMLGSLFTCPRGLCTSKEMVETRSYGKKLFFYGPFPQVFW